MSKLNKIIDGCFELMEKKHIPEYIFIISSYFIIKDFMPDLLNSLRNRHFLLNHSHCAYSNEEEAKKDLGIEKDKLGLNDLEINLNFDDETENANTVFEKDKPYKISLGKGTRNRLSLRHELYHIKRNEKQGYSFWIYLLTGIEEWKATSYAIEDHK